MMSRIPYWMHCWTVWQCHQLSKLRIGNVPLEWCPMKDEDEFVVNLGRVILRIQELYIILSTKWNCSFFSRPKHFLRLAGQVQRRRPCWLWHCRRKNYEDLTSDWCCNFLLGRCTFCVWFKKLCLGGGFKHFVFSTLFGDIWGRFPIWLIFFRWVETTN